MSCGQPISIAVAAGHTDSVLCCQVLQGKKLLASGGEVRGTGNKHAAALCSLRAAAAAACSLTACRLLAAATAAACAPTPAQDGAICLTDLTTLKPAGRITQELGDAVPSLCALPGDDHTLFAAAGAAVLQLDLRRGLDASALLRCFGVNAEEVNSVAASSANGGWVAAADDSGEVQVLSLAAPGDGAQEPLRPGRPAAYKTLRRGHANICAAVAFRPHRPWEVLSGGLDSNVVRWDFSRLRPLQTWDMGGEAAASGGKLGAGPEQLGCGRALGRPWMAATDTPRACRRTAAPAALPVPAGQMFNPPMVHSLAVPQTDDRQLCRLMAVGRGDGCVVLYDADWKPSATSSSGGGGGGGRKGGKGAAARQRGGGGARQQQQQQQQAGRLALLGQEQGGHTAGVNSVAFFPGGASWQQLLAAGNDCRLLLWDWGAACSAGQEAAQAVAEQQGEEEAGAGRDAASSSSLRQGGPTGEEDAAAGGSADGSPAAPPLLAAQHRHARKINCACTADVPGCSYNVFLADTGRRLTALALA